MSDRYQQLLAKQIEELKSEGLYKTERVITSAQNSTIKVKKIMTMSL